MKTTAKNSAAISFHSDGECKAWTAGTHHVRPTGDEANRRWCERTQVDDKGYGRVFFSATGLTTDVDPSFVNVCHAFDHLHLVGVLFANYGRVQLLAGNHHFVTETDAQ